MNTAVQSIELPGPFHCQADSRVTATLTNQWLKHLQHLFLEQASQAQSSKIACSNENPLLQIKRHNWLPDIYTQTANEQTVALPMRYHILCEHHLLLYILPISRVMYLLVLLWPMDNLHQSFPAWPTVGHSLAVLSWSACYIRDRHPD